MLNRSINIFLIVFVLIAQTGEAIAVSAITCIGADSTNKQMILDADESMQEIADNGTGSMDHSCCQQECECPQGMLSLAVLINGHVQTSANLVTSLQFDIDSQLADVFIPDQKRPPISL